LHSESGALQSCPVIGHLAPSWLRGAAWLLLALLPSTALAQNNSLKGKFEDVTTRAPISNVQVTLKSFADTSEVHKVTAKDDGTFEVTRLGDHSYKLEALRLGYTPLRIVIRVTKKNQEAGVLGLTPETIPVSGVTVVESPAPAIQKADTTEYRASAVKTHKDATAEDLVQKLPGVTMENGQIKAQGENVQNVLVNGRPFFGSDPTAAMRNLPAEVVDRIQVYDRMSDQAEFSGFDDNTSQKTMNFVLRDLKTKFGKVYGGYGDQDRYQAGASLTLLRGPTRVTAIGMSNNINQRNFSIQDLFGGLTGTPGGGPRMMMFGGGGGAMFRGGGGGGGGQIFRMGGFGGAGFDPSSFLVGQQPGISETHSGGVNYVGQWTRRLSVSSSVFVNNTDNANLQIMTRQFLPPQDSIAFYDQNTRSDSKNGNQRVDARFEWTPDSTNSVIFQPRLYYQQSDADTKGAAENTTEEGAARSSALSRSNDVADGDNLSGRLTLRHRFARRGRNVSAEFNVGHNVRDGNGTQNSLTNSFDPSSSTRDTLDQESNSQATTNTFSTRVAFTEPLVPHLQAQAIYNPSVSRSLSDARAFSLDPTNLTYTLPESALSNSYETKHTAQNGGLALLLTDGPWKLLGNASYQSARLQSEQTFPISSTIDRTFEDFLPSATLTGNFANRRSMRLAWSTSTAPPTIGQLQNVVNNSNPLSLSVGNPDLRPTYTNAISFRWSQADPLKSTSKFLFANVARTAHPIANSTFTAPFDTTVNGVFLARGTQLTAPVNLDESWNGNLFGVYSRPMKLMKSIVSLNAGGTWTRTPSRINGLDNTGSAYAIRSGLVVASNISQNLDFTVTYFGTYNISRNTLTNDNTGDYYSSSAGLRLNAVVSHGVVMREELNHNLQSGVPSAYGQDVMLWNTTLGKKFLKNDSGELRVTLTDVFEQNRSVSRSVTESYVQDSRDSALGRFVQAVFTYTFR